MSDQQAVRFPWLRRMLKIVMVFGFVLITIGPIARVRNEGFGEEPGPIAISNYWQQVSYVLFPLGISIIILVGIALVVVDRRQ